ncbi:MAG: hypothetical protein NNA31_02830 [Nitrospira sp.]|nr:hypothetical protein [Nitrospira sp.]
MGLCNRGPLLYWTKLGVASPMDMEWATDGRTGELFIVQARPETVQSRRDVDVFETDRLAERGRVLVSGRSVGGKIGQGTVRVIEQVQ